MLKITRVFLLAALSVLFSGCDPAEVATVSNEEPAAVVSAPAGEAEAVEPRLAVAEPATRSSPAIIAFLKKFDELSAKGFVPTLRRGSTGIGYTLETMLGIEENNSPGGDFMGMEVKAFRDDDLAMDDSEKMNLFLKEPKWIDGLKSADRIRKYGYVDDNGRTALYSAVTIVPSSHHFAFEVDADSSKVWLLFNGQRIAFWSYEILAKRLKEKHTETVFVSAHTRGKGKGEAFHYYGVTWVREPSVDAFVRLLREGAVMLELRMHLKETGSVRNHGSCFRIKQNRIKDLFRFSEQVRP